MWGRGRRRRLDRLATEVSQLWTVVDDLQTELTLLRDRMDYRDESAFLGDYPLPEPSFAPSPDPRPELPDVASYRPDLGELRLIVEDLIEEANLRQHVLHCWFRHPPAALILSALAESRDFRASSYNNWVWDVEIAKGELRSVFRRCRAGHVGPITDWDSEAYGAAFAVHCEGLRADGWYDEAEMTELVHPFVMFLVVQFGLQQHVLHCWFKHPQVISTMVSLRSTMNNRSLPGWIQPVAFAREELRIAFRRCRAGHVADAARWNVASHHDLDDYLRGFALPHDEL